MVDSILKSSKRKSTGMDSGPETKRFRPNFNDTITVVVGEEKELFTVHTATICRKSEFFKAACKREWQESKDKTVPLPDIKPPVFTLYVNWAYTGVLDVEIIDDSLMAQDRSQDPDMIQAEKDLALSDHRQSNIIALYLAADFLLDEELKERAIDKLLEVVWGSSFNLQPTRIAEIWASSATDSGLRRLILDTVISHSKGSNYIAQSRGDDKIPADFFIDVAERSLSLHGPLRAVKPTLSRKEHYYDRSSFASGHSPAPANPVRYKTLEDVEDPRTRKYIQEMQMIVAESVQRCFDALVKKHGNKEGAIAWLAENGES
ncbi:hypothetical protein LTR27_008302 [Elasticomyces elasticus]|nr:hypothetical protein LTR27_008302 [Elasticomyces elasticus]